jgi:hypothetical protein
MCFVAAPHKLPRLMYRCPTTTLAARREVVEKQVRDASRMCDAAYQFPLRFDARKEIGMMHLTMDKDKAEIDCILALMHSTCPHAKVFGISRVMNHYLADAFRKTRAQLRSGRLHWETFAWHGTRTVLPARIIHAGFDPAHAKSSPATTWFAEQAQYSDNLFAHHTSMSTTIKAFDGSVVSIPIKQIFLARLLVSHKDERNPLPQRVWTLHNAITRALPAYLITYQ